MALLGAVVGLSGCFPLALTGAAVGTMAVLDRRTLGAQTEDQSIELKSLRELNRVFANGEASVTVTSFNRRVLLAGQAASEQDRKRAEEVVRSAAFDIRELYNEIEIGNTASFSTHTRDSGLTARVKAALVRERDLPSNAIKVVSEVSTVYLMGLVTQDEGDRAAHIAARVNGATRVVTTFEYLTAQDLAKIQATDRK
ncbi:MAG: BON domain-containing protein [Burkholderiaceae bacterium]